MIQYQETWSYQNHIYNKLKDEKVYRKDDYYKWMKLYRILL